MRPTALGLALWRTTVALIVAALTAAFVALGVTTPERDRPAPGTATATEGNPAPAR